MIQMDTFLPVMLIYSFIIGNKMNARTKKKIVLEALTGGEEATSALVVAMIVPFIHDHESAIHEVRKYIPKPYLGLFTSRLCDELRDSGSSSTAKICYAAFKKEINRYIDKLKRIENAKTEKHKAAKQKNI